MSKVVKRPLKEALFRVVNAALPAPRLFAGNYGVVLDYHDVPDRGGFARQMRALKSLGLALCGLDRLIDLVSGDASPDAPFAAVTFDDGYESQLHNAVPALIDAGIPASFFVVADRLGARSRWAPEFTGAGHVPDLPLLTENQVREVAALGFEIGCHSASHASLGEAPFDLEAEIAASRRRLEDLVGRRVRAFAYPYGRHTPPVVEAVARAGYDVAFTVDRAPLLLDGGRVDPYTLPRIAVEANIAEQGLRAYVTGRALQVWELRRKSGLAKAREIIRVLSGQA